MDQRQQQLASWVTAQLKEKALVQSDAILPLTPVSGDASFRRYFRATTNGRSFIAMDAPPEKENSAPFVAIANSWFAAGVPVPEIYAADLGQGFMLLSDMGDVLYLDRLTAQSADALYQQALQTLVHIQPCCHIKGYELPHYNEARLTTEMELCPEWFFSKLLGLRLEREERKLLTGVFDALVSSALEQPQVCVHRDYHSRNLMLLQDGGVGVLDFQDAVLGPVSYDLVSLIRDCYISWPAPQEEKWIKQYMALAKSAKLIESVEYAQFKGWFDWMGLQRHIKCVGIFSRLYLRDGKAGYLKDIPRTFDYLKVVCAAYPQFAEFNQWLDDKIVPAMASCTDLAIRQDRQA